MTMLDRWRAHRTARQTRRDTLLLALLTYHPDGIGVAELHQHLGWGFGGLYGRLWRLETAGQVLVPGRAVSAAADVRRYDTGRGIAVTGPVDVDNLPPTHYLLAELLAARHRTGETWWTLPTSALYAARMLQHRGLVETIHGREPKTFRAKLTDAGRAAFMPADWTPPAPGNLAALLRYAAEGRREYLPNLPEDVRPLVEVEIATLEQAAVVADGRLDPLYNWLPSWRWTPEMHARLDESRREVAP